MLLVILLILLLIGGLPLYPYSANWGYYPSGGIGLVLLIVIILLIAGRLAVVSNCGFTRQRYLTANRNPYALVDSPD
jgi:hypothetical protein